MCIAIVKPKGKTIPTEHLKNSFDNNQDGGGVAYSKNGKVHIIKGIFSKKKFVKTVRFAEKEADGAILIHCRIGTSGLKDENNCHPHVVNDECVLMHNGVLSITVPSGSKISDTVIFINEYLKPLENDFMKNEAITKLVEKAIGSNNKFALLNNKGEYKIINEKAGVWENGVWYSNSTYSYQKYKPVTKSYCGYNDIIKNWNGQFYNKYGYPIQKVNNTKTTTLSNKAIKITEAKQLSFFEEQKYDEKKIKKEIDNLTYKDILNLSYYPMWDIKNEKLVCESEARLCDLANFVFLDDINQHIYQYYIDKVEILTESDEFFYA